MGFLVLLKQHNAIPFGRAASTMHRRTVEGVGKEDQKFSKAILLDTRSCGRYSYHVCSDGRKSSSRRVGAPVFSVYILHSVILTEHIPCPRCPGNDADMHYSCMGGEIVNKLYGPEWMDEDTLELLSHSQASRGMQFRRGRSHCCPTSALSHLSRRRKARLEPCTTLLWGQAYKLLHARQGCCFKDAATFCYPPAFSTRLDGLRRSSLPVVTHSTLLKRLRQP